MGLSSLQAYAVAGLAAAAVAFGAGYKVRGHKADADLEALRSSHAQERTRMEVARADAVARVRQEERDNQRKLQEAQDAEYRKRLEAEAARRRADAAAVGLRDELQATRAELDALQNDPSTSPGCKAAAEAGAMCAVLLGRCNDRRTELAEFAESSARAGELCVRAYEALTPPGPPGP